MKKAIAVARATFFALCGFTTAVPMLLPGPSAAAQTSAPKAVYPLRTYDFGTVEQGQKVSHCFAVRNDGTAPLTTTGMQLPSPEIVARAPASMAPGQAGQVCVDLDTSSMSRRVHTWAIIFSNDPVVPKLPLYLNGVVKAPIDLIPFSTVFASLFKGEGAKRGVIVVNNQKKPLKITALETQGQHFKASVQTRKPGQIYEVAIEIPPSVPPGRYTEFADLLTDSPERPRIRITIDLLVKEDIYAFPTRIDFGRVSENLLAGTPDKAGQLTASFLVKKREGQFRVTSIDSNVPGLQLTQTPQGPGETFRFDIALPANRLKPGRINGNIQLHTDDEKVPEVIVPIHGEVQ